VGTENTIIAPWLFFAFLTPVLYPIANYCDKVALDHFGIKPLQLCAVVYFGFAVQSLAVALAGQEPIASFTAGVPLLLAGVLFVVFALPYYKALTLDEASVVVPLFQFSPVFVILFDVAVLGERFTPYQALGSAIILGCGFACALEREPGQLFKVRPALWYMLLSSLLYAASGPLMRIGLSENSPNSALFYQSLGMLCTALGLFVVAKRRGDGPLRGRPPLFWLLITLNCTVGTVALLGAIRAVAEVSASLARVVEASQPIFIFILGAVLTRLYPLFVHEDLRTKTIVKKVAIGCGIVIGAYFLQLT